MSERIVNYPGDAERRQGGLLDILWDELKPFPGRARAALRLAIACTAIVLVSNTFRLPLQDVLPFLVLFTVKEEKVTTAITARASVLPGQTLCEPTPEWLCSVCTWPAAPAHDATRFVWRLRRSIPSRG